MKKRPEDSASEQDFTIGQLPHTRPQVFWDRLRTCPGKLLLCGLLLLLFALPLLAAGLFADLSFGALSERFASGELTEADYQGAARSLLYAAAPIKVLGYTILGIGAAGVARQIRQMIFGESYEYWHDFGFGIRQNAAWYCLCFFLIGLFRVFGEITMQGYEGVMAYLPQCVFALLIFPILLHLLVQATLYTHAFLTMWRTAIFMYAKTVPVSILFSLIFLAWELTDRLPFTARCYARVITLILLPLIFMAWYLYAMSALDKYINRLHYPELVDRGVRREESTDTSDGTDGSGDGTEEAQNGAGQSRDGKA